MEKKIAFILEGEHHCKRIKEILKELGKDYQVYSGGIDVNSDNEAVELAKTLVKDGAEVIISAGKFGENIVKSVTVPVVIIRRGRISFASAAKEARKYSKKFAIIGRKGVFLDAALQFKSLFDDDILVEGFETDEEIPRVLKRLKEEKIEILITGSRGKRYAMKSGFLCVSVPFEREDMLSAMREAEHILKYIETKNENMKFLSTIQNNVSEGILVIDHNGVVTIINNSGLSMFNLRTSEVHGQKLTDTIFSPIAEVEALTSLQNCEGEIVVIRNQVLSVNINHIKLENKLKTTLVTFSLIDLIQKKEKELRRKIYSKGHIASYTFDRIVGRSKPMQKTISSANKFAKVNSTILINGPTGSGKEVFAQSIHNASNRSNGPFVVINCAALPESLLESVLFGYDKGAYTGAHKDGKSGLFEIAHGGTVFLDEISEMPLKIQSRFLRVLQEKEVMPIGSDRVIPIDVRVLSATNRDLNQLIERGEFREDLYYRIAILQLDIPPLNQRRDDIASLVKFFIHSKSKEIGIENPSIDYLALQYMEMLNYSGNVRQLENLMERILVLSEGNSITYEFVKEHLGYLEATRTNVNESLDNSLKSISKQEDFNIKKEQFEEAKIRSTLIANKGNRAITAKLLNMSTTTLWRKIKKYEIIEI